MSLKRKAIRHTIVKLLTAQAQGIYPTAAQDRVFANRPTPLWSSELPAICVYIKKESAEKSVYAPVVYSRKPRIVVEILVEGIDGCDDLLDEIQNQVETVLFGNGYLRDPDDNKDRFDGEIELESTDMELAQVGEMICGSNVITFIGDYDTEAPTLLTEDDLDDFNTANNKISDMNNTVTVREE